MSKYANTTTVSVDKSRADIRKTLLRYEAHSVGFLENNKAVCVEFSMSQRRIRFLLILPDIENFTRTPTGKTRTQSAAKKAREQSERQIWRALHLLVKAKLEAVESGIATIEQEFMPNTVLPDGSTVSELVLPQIREAYNSGMLPQGISGLLPSPTKENIL